MDAFIMEFGSKDFDEIVADLEGSSQAQPAANPAEPMEDAGTENVAAGSGPAVQAPDDPGLEFLRAYQTATGLKCKVPPVPYSQPKPKLPSGIAPLKPKFQGQPLTPPKAHEPEAPLGMQQPKTPEGLVDEAKEKALAMYAAVERTIRQVSAAQDQNLEEDVAYKWTEQKMATSLNIKRRDRGPKDSNLTVWRKQPWRKGSHRFAKRAGKNREYFKQKYGTRSQAPSSSSSARPAQQP